MTQTLAPVDQERIEAVLDEFDLKHFRGDDGTTRTAFPGLVVFFQIEDFGFKVSTRWLATAREHDDIQVLRSETNLLNQMLMLIRVHPIIREDGTAVVLIEAPFFTTAGVTDEQLSQMLGFYFSEIHRISERLGAHMPQILDESEA